MSWYDSFRIFAKGAAPAPKSASKGGKAFLPPASEPKLKPKQQSVPGYLTTATPNTEALIQKIDSQLANLDIVSNYRGGATTPDVIRAFARANPDLAAALSAYIRVGIPEKYIALARNPDGSVNDDGCRIAFEVLQRFDKLPSYDTGFSQVDSIRSVSEALAKEAMIYGGMGCELVLDKGRMPLKFQPFNVHTVRFYPDTAGGTMGLKPVQIVGGQETDLDIATVFMVWLDPDLRDAYMQSPFESAVQAVIASSTFVNDLRRVMARHVYPRYDVKINEEKFRASIPPEVAADPEVALPAYINATIAQVETAINTLALEDALIHFDFIEIGYIANSDGRGDALKFDSLKNILDANLAKGAHVPSAILSNGSGTQNTASTETMLFMLSANGKIRLKLQELYSKLLTLSVRLFGLDVTVDFEFDPIELRPETELLAFKAQYYETLKDMWAKGLISDMEACLRMTHRPLPPSFKPLSGTYFTTGGDPNGAPATPPSAKDNNNYSGTAVGGGQSGGGAGNQSRQPATSPNPKGK